MFTALARQLPQDEPTPELDARARTALMVLCVLYLVLGVVHVSWFMATDLAALRLVAAESQERLATLRAAEAEGPAVEVAATQAATTANAVARGWGRFALLLAAIAVVGLVAAVQARRVTSRAEAVASATMMIVLAGSLLLASRLLMQKAMPGEHVTGMGLLDILVLHLLACLILPWTPRESATPMILLLLVWAITFLVPASPDPDWNQILDRLVGVIVSPAALIPGMLLAGWRWRRSQEDAERLHLGRQVRSLGGELSRARIVHDAMFPRPFDMGHVRFEYDYRPIAEIGGDYVHLHRCRESGRISLTMLDVAGHGLAAALTVNRLFGELERIRAEDPDAEPAQVIRLLNRYIHLTMAPHSLYATGTCLCLDPASGRLEWVNAGHPPALLRKGDGRVLDLPGTSILLGVQGDDEFDPGQRSVTLEPGDVVIAYTDGAFEARNAEGLRFGIPSLRDTAAFTPPPRDWSRFIANAVTRHHGGHAEDDVLVASLHLRSLFIGELHHQSEVAGREAPAPAPARDEVTAAAPAGAS